MINSAQPGPYAVGVGGPCTLGVEVNDHKGVTLHCHSQPGVGPAWGTSTRPGTPSLSTRDRYCLGHLHEAWWGF